MTEKVLGEFGYPGSELDLFAHAHNWKRYVTDRLTRYISGDVAEVGAGIGETTRTLSAIAHARWLAIEPDRALADRIFAKCAAGALPATVEPLVGSLATLDATLRFDTILYIDVLEHIEDDGGEVLQAAARLRPGGRLVVLAPAYQRLFSAFDASIGHYRRYTAKSLDALAPAGLVREAGFYLDAVGVSASFANMILLKQSSPKPSQIALWDKVMVPLSRIVDPMIGRSAGRSVVQVWRKPG